MNEPLYRLHLVLATAIAIGGSLLALLTLSEHQAGLMPPWLFFLAVSMPVAAFHFLAARGAKLGRGWGRILSITYACVAILGFPVGTAIAIYVFTLTGRRWKSAPWVKPDVSRKGG